MTDLQIVRKWHTDPVLLEAVRGLFTYGPNDDRATGHVYGEGRKWPESLIAIGPLLLSDLHALLGIQYEIVAFQAYRDGAGCGWHTDSPFDAQAVLSLGTARHFEVRKFDGQGDPGRIRPQRMLLNHGDLVVMPSGFQKEWQHCVPTEDVKGERCSLVFRTVLRD